MKKLSLMLYIAVAAMPSYSFAAKLDTYKGTSLDGFLKFVRTWLLGIAGAIAVLFIVIGGVKLVTSAGNPKRLEDAKKTLTYAIIGLIAVLLSTVILNIIAGDFVGAVFSGSMPY